LASLRVDGRVILKLGLKHVGRMEQSEAEAQCERSNEFSCSIKAVLSSPAGIFSSNTVYRGRNVIRYIVKQSYHCNHNLNMFYNCCQNVFQFGEYLVSKTRRISFSRVKPGRPIWAKSSDGRMYRGLGDKTYLCRSKVNADLPN
jgi:hypothetical protein